MTIDELPLGEVGILAPVYEEDLSSETVLVAREGGRVVGFADVEITSAFRNSAIYDHGGYRFHYLDHGMLSDRLVHIVAEVAEAERAARPGHYVRAWRGRAEIGVFESTSAAEFSGRSELDDTGFVEGLSVVPEEQGRGLGLVLHARGLLEMRRAGYRLADTLHECRRRA